MLINKQKIFIFKIFKFTPKYEKLEDFLKCFGLLHEDVNK